MLAGRLSRIGSWAVSLAAAWYLVPIIVAAVHGFGFDFGAAFAPWLMFLGPIIACIVVCAMAIGLSPVTAERDTHTS